MSNKKYCVYIHINKYNWKVYIGQTCNKKTRFYDNSYRPCVLFHRAIMKYGGLQNGFITIILKDGLTKEESDEWEKFYIKQYNSTNKEFGYNICNGGAGVGCKHTEQWKIDHSKRMMGSGNPNYGKHWDEKHRKIISKKQKGMTRKREQWEIDKIKETHKNMKHYNDKRVRCITTNEVFDSQRQCARILSERYNITIRGFEIGHVCKGLQQKTHGYMFEYV